MYLAKLKSKFPFKITKVYHRIKQVAPYISDFCQSFSGYSKTKI